MIIPVRCFTCGKVIADKYQPYLDMLHEDVGATEAQVLDTLGIHRYCCRRMFISHQDMNDVLLKYNASDNALRDV